MQGRILVLDDFGGASDSECLKTAGRAAVAATKLFLRAACPSINHFQRELNLPRVPCRLADDAEAAAPQNVRRQAEIHDVENVEELGAKF